MPCALSSPATCSEAAPRTLQDAEPPSPLSKYTHPEDIQDESALSQLSPGKNFKSVALTSLTPSKERSVLRRVQRSVGHSHYPKEPRGQQRKWIKLVK